MIRRMTFVRNTTQLTLSEIALEELVTNNGLMCSLLRLFTHKQQWPMIHLTSVAVSSLAHYSNELY